MIIVVACGLGAPSRAHAAIYTVTDLGNLGSNPTVANDINQLGQVTGQSNLSNASWAFSYSNGVMTPVNAGIGHSINDSGEITGELPAFVYKNGVATPLNFGDFTWGRGINNNGVVTGGFIADAPGPRYAFTYINGNMTNLGPIVPGGTSDGYAINDAGQVTGSGALVNGNLHAFIYTGGIMQDLGTLGGAQSHGRDINQSGQVAGYAFTSAGQFHAFFYDGIMHDLGTLPGGVSSIAWGLNDLGNVVGHSGTASGQHAFIYKDGSMIDLNSLIDPSSNWTLESGQAINNSGQIVGHGFIGNNTTDRAFLLTPVPEPHTLAGAAAAIIFLRRRKTPARGGCGEA